MTGIQKRSGRVVIVASFVLSPNTVDSQTPASGIQLISSHQISVDAKAQPHAESFIAVAPRDPRHLLATAMGIVKGVAHAYPYVSFDGGKTWTRGKIRGDTSIVKGADPVVYLTQSGTAFFSILAEVEGRKRSIISRSADGGRTWSTVAVLPLADRQWLAFDSSTGPFSGRTYFTGTGVHPTHEGARTTSPYLVRSDDDGSSFPFRSVVAYDRGGSAPSAPISAVPLEMHVSPGGLLVLPLQGGDRDTVERLRRDSLDGRAVGLVISGDGGESFGPARYAPTYRLTTYGSSRRRFRDNAAVGYVRTAMDASSSPYRNTVYFVASDYDRTIDRFVVRAWRTTDFGKTWRTSVASDAPRGDVANPAITVNRDGVVAVTWNDRRDDPKGECWRLYAAISTDGGETFRPAQRLSREPTCTNQPENWVTFGSAFNSEQRGQQVARFQTGAVIPTRFANGGDTQGLVADATGTFHAAWINGATGVLQLWHTSFRLDAALLAELRSRPAAAAQAGVSSVPRGLEDVTGDIRFHVAKTDLDFRTRTQEVTLQIENRSGRPLTGPLHAVMVHFLDQDGGLDRGGGLENLRVANADSGGAGVGATWTFNPPNGVLAPGARTLPRVIRFAFDGGMPAVPDGGYLTPGFRVYARAESSTRQKDRSP